MSLTTLEAQVKAEWNVVRAWVALHPYSSMVILAAAGWVAGHLHIPV